jgi:hypothetical protein
MPDQGRVGLPALEQPVHRSQYTPERRLRQFRQQALAAPPLSRLEDLEVGECLITLAVVDRAARVIEVVPIRNGEICLSRHAGDCPYRARSSTLRGPRRSGRGPPARSAPTTRSEQRAVSSREELPAHPGNGRPRRRESQRRLDNERAARGRPVRYCSDDVRHVRRVGVRTGINPWSLPDGS